MTGAPISGGALDETAEAPVALALGSKLELSDSDEIPGAADDSPLAPLTPGDAPAPRRRGPGRPRKHANAHDTARAAKDRRNAKLREQRARERAIRATEQALGMPSPKASAPADAPQPGGVFGDVPATPAAEVQLPDGQLAILLGLGCDATARMIPAKYGGGGLTEEEREILGGVWAAALAPYLSGTASVMGIAIISTVQIFAMRAIRQNGPDAPAEPQPTRKVAATAPAAAEAPAKQPDAPAPVAPAPQPGQPIKPGRLRKVPSVIRD